MTDVMSTVYLQISGNAISDISLDLCIYPYKIIKSQQHHTYRHRPDYLYHMLP